MNVSLVSASTFLLLATSSAASAIIDSHKKEPLYMGRLRVYGSTTNANMDIKCKGMEPSSPWNWYGLQIQLPPTAIGNGGTISPSSVGALSASDGYSQPANNTEELFVDWNFTAADEDALIRWRTNDDVVWSQKVFTTGGTLNTTSGSSTGCDDSGDFAAGFLTVSLDYSLEEGVGSAEGSAAVGTDGGPSRRLRYP